MTEAFDPRTIYAPDPADLAEVYEDALRRIVEVLGTDREDAAVTALTIAADALGNGDAP